MVDFCNICGELKLNFKDHVCPPCFEVREETDENGWKKIYAHDIHAAVEKWAKCLDQEGDYLIMSGSDMTCFVRHAGSNEEKKFIVSGEFVPKYTARYIGE